MLLSVDTHRITGSMSVAGNLTVNGSTLITATTVTNPDLYLRKTFVKKANSINNNIKDIQEKLNTTQYSRLRFGISNKFSKGRQVDYVLGVWSDEESSKLDEQLNRVSKSLISFVMSGVNETMNQFNGA